MTQTMTATTPASLKAHEEARPATTASRVAEELKRIGIDHLFLMTGRDNALWIALEAAGIRHVLARSEPAAVYMADAYARIRNAPAFTYGAYGPGAANVAGALAEPYWSSSPVIALVSAMRRSERFRREYQELDQVPLFSSVTKWAVEASSSAHVPRLVREAVRQSLSGTPGPVYLGIPGDIFEEEVSDGVVADAALGPMRLPLTRPAPSAADIEAVVAALTSAERPIILAGNGVHHSGAHQVLTDVAERLGVPVATSSAGKGSIAETHDMALGTVGRYSRKYANAALRNADVILAIGTQLGGLVTDSYRLIGPGAKLIHVTVDANAIGLNFPTHLGIVADARTFLESLLEACERRGVRASAAASASMGALAAERQAWRQRRAELARQDGSSGPMRPEAVMAAIDAQMADDAILLADTGYAAAWAGALAEVRIAGRSFLRADGSLGWSFPAALGAQLAAPDRQVICVIGDGGFGYHLSEIETALRLGLPVVAVILNNGTLAFEAHVQTHLYGHVVPEVNDFRDVDYGGVARAFGAQGFRVTNAAEMSRALAIGLERRAPTIIDAIIDREAMAPVTRYDRVRDREL